MMRKLLIHLDFVKAKIKHFDDIQLKFVALLACKRQSFLYQKAAYGEPWENVIGFNQVIDYAWGNLISAQVFNADHYLEDIYPPADTFGSSIGYAEFVCDSLTFLIEMFNKMDSVNNLQNICEIGLNIVDSIGYDVLGFEMNSINDELVDESEVVYYEIERQKRDIEFAEKNNLTDNIIKKYREEFSSEDITLGYWFTE